MPSSETPIYDVLLFELGDPHAPVPQAGLPRVPVSGHAATEEIPAVTAQFAQIEPCGFEYSAPSGAVIRCGLPADHPPVHP